VKTAQNGWLHPPGDDVTLAAQLEEAGSDREKLFEMGLNGRKEFEKRFTIDAVSNQYHALYLEICGGAQYH
jgi:glycosyltransferase involved in cell wall biosynthesis